MTRRTAAALALAVAVSVGGCASTPNGTHDDLAGCWYFERDDAAREMGLPWGVRLTPDTLTGWSVFRDTGARVAVTLIGPDQTSDRPFGYWQPLEGDTVVIGNPAQTGYLATLAVAGHEMTGTARPIGDAGLGPRPEHPVRLTRALCPGEEG